MQFTAQKYLHGIYNIYYQVTLPYLVKINKHLQDKQPFPNLSEVYIMRNLG